MRRLLVLILVAFAVCSFYFVSVRADDATPEATADPIEVLVPEVLNVYPHDSESYTQGLLLHDGVFYESAGLHGKSQSSLRRVDPTTGEVLQRLDIPEEYFGEGLALVDDRLIQLTWKGQTAFVYDLATFEQVGTFNYEGEGWGLCYDGDALYMSDGSPIITVRDPETFEPTARILVTFQDQLVKRLNELECVGDAIYANVWLTPYIVRIDKATGVIDGVIDAAGLLTPEEVEQLDGDNDAVLNGIAYDPENDVFYITGKLWPHVFEVRFVPGEPQG